MIPAVRAVRPVLPPASTPDADSTNVVTVDVPEQAPATVPIASERRASFMLGILPCLSSMLALEAVPTRVPIVSNISIIQNVMISVTAVKIPISKRPLKSNLNNVVSTISLKGGINEAVFNDSKGLVPSTTPSQIQ